MPAPCRRWRRPPGSRARDRSSCFSGRPEPGGGPPPHPPVPEVAGKPLVLILQTDHRVEEHPMRSARTSVFATAVLMLIIGGCPTIPSAYRNRVCPINRTTSTAPPYQSYHGTVVGVDPTQRVIVLDDGRTYRVVGEQAVTVNGQPIVLERVQPGTPVTIVSGTPVIYQNGQYVAVAPGTTTAVAVPSASMARVYG